MVGGMSIHPIPYSAFFFFFFNDTATTEIYTLSLHDALPICGHLGCAPLLGVSILRHRGGAQRPADQLPHVAAAAGAEGDRKSTRLNSSHGYISYAVFCLKKKKTSNSTRSSRA